MAINKVVYGNNTLIDLTEDTVSADKLLAGETAHDKSGASIEGTVVTTEIWTGTQAEYEAQASQIADGTVVQITDDEKAITFIEGEEVYSTDERMVGVSTDGKPVYKKSYITTTNVTLGTSWSGVVFTVANVEKPIKAELIRYTGSAYTTYPIGCNNDNGFKFVTFTGSVNCQVGSIFTVWYTKTTDVAGSGDFVPSGAPAVHYSTDEQVVGTWIDGRTVYEKTFLIAKSDLVSQGSNNYGYAWNLGYDKIIRYDGTVLFSNGYINLPNGTTDSNYSLYISASNTTNLVLRIANNIYNQLSEIILTVRYTKTS